MEILRFLEVLPEAQLILKDKKAEIHPIAGTFARSGDDMNDPHWRKN